MEKFIDRLLERRWLVLAVFILLAALGMYAWKGVATQVPGLAVAEIEQQITVPLERELNGIPGLKVMRSKNFFGISKITLVFEDGVDDYWARQRVMERIADIELPFGAQPGLDPLTSPTGEIFRYVVAGDRSLRELTDLNHWVIIPRLKQIYGIADVSNFGGITTQYQIEIDPDRLTAYGLSLSEVTDAIEDNNANAGGSTLMRGVPPSISGTSVRSSTAIWSARASWAISTMRRTMRTECRAWFSCSVTRIPPGCSGR